MSDPGIRFGPFRVMRRTDHKVIVVDERRPLAQGTVDVLEGPDTPTIERATQRARTLWEAEGCPAYEP